MQGGFKPPEHTLYAVYQDLLCGMGLFARKN